MNQFKKYDFNKNKIALNIAKDFDYILNNLWSTYSEAKGIRRWRDIRDSVPSKYHKKISIEIGHVEVGHGREQALMAVKSEMEAYLDYLMTDVLK